MQLWEVWSCLVSPAIASSEREIHRLRTKARDYESQEKPLIHLLRYGEVNNDDALDELGKLKKEREADQHNLEQYASSRDHLKDLENAVVSLTECCQRVHNNLNTVTWGYKRTIPETLDIGVAATPDRISISGAIPLEPTQSDAASPNSLTTGQTSGYRLCCTYEYPSTEPVVTIVA
jgi:hypothetical protein